MDLCYGEVCTTIDEFYKRGGRSLYLEGGEPYLWSDGQYTIEDIIKYAHYVGYYTVIIYTNGTFSIDTSADMIFISIDGLQKTHDYIRGESFNKIIRNINESNHSSLFVNFTINNINKNTLEAFCKYITQIKKIRGVFFYFHTPYYGNDDLYIDQYERSDILLRLLSYKKKYRILNSRAGLKSAIRNDWNRPLDICQVYEKGTTFTCCRFSGDPALCQNCGYLSYAEIDQTFHFRPSAIFNALKYY